MEQLVTETSLSKSTIQRLFKGYLKEPPRLSVYPSERVNLLIDGTYFSRDLCLILYRDNTIKFTQLYRFSDGERYEELKEDLENLLLLGVQIESITCDGHRALLRAIRKVCPQVTLQRCVIHVQRMCRIWLSSNPKSIPGQELRRIVSTLHLVQSKQELSYWLLELANWDGRHHEFVHEKTVNPITGKYWYKHKLLRRSFSVLKSALPNLFAYLDNPRIPKSTNGLESFFGHLKTNLTIHRGLSTGNRKSFLRWYLYFKNARRKGFS
ncbi:transposase [Microcystis aeruginosa]|uniref:IS256 family transposase, variant Zn-binding type n=1 Tax=Microcystis aeruginosa TaxID=1126 RepID=UPI001C8918EA|nr:transposase [Microcystis aeruginosa]